MNKAAVHDLILQQLRTDLAQQTQAAQLSRDEAINEESRPQNKYDMHSQEAAYLAEGQARLAAEIAESLRLYASLPLSGFEPTAPVALGALVRVDAGSRRHWYFLGPRAGGIEVESEGHTVLVLSPQSPLGRELLGKRLGDPVRLPGKAGSTPSRIAEIL